jgi:toxin ParE1/3/4
VRHLRWAREARSDLIAIDAFYRPLDAEFARRALASAVAAGSFLLEWPRAGHLIEDAPPLRKWRVAGTPYSLICREEPGGLRVLRVVHAAHDWRVEP